MLPCFFGWRDGEPPGGHRGTSRQADDFELGCRKRDSNEQPGSGPVFIAAPLRRVGAF